MLHRSHRQPRPRRARVGVLLLLGLAVALGFAAPVSAHAVLLRSSPAGGSIQVTGPASVDLWFSEHVVPARSSVIVYDATRARVSAGPAVVDPADPSHLSVPLEHLPDGTYTVAWSTMSAVDAHATAGAFTFRVGHDRFPGAAATQGQSPSLPAVALRWLGVLGLAFTGGWFLMGILGATGDARRVRLALAGAVVTLAADLALVPVLAYLPVAGQSPQSVVTTLVTMPAGWLARVVLEVALVVAVAFATQVGPARLVQAAGLTLTAAALATLALTSHAAAIATAQVAAMVTDALHVVTAVLWTGGLLQLAISPDLRRSGEPAHRFARLSLLLVPVAIVTGGLSAGVTLPSLASLVQSTYGRVLLVKSLLVAAALILVWLGRYRLRGGLERVGRVAFSVRGAAVVMVGALLAASLLALTAPPAPASQPSLQLRASVGTDRAIHLVIGPPAVGDVAVQAWLTTASDRPVTGVDAVQVSFSNLEQSIDLPALNATPDAGGRWSLPAAPLTVQGWWSASVRFTGRSLSPAETTFYFRVPDPTLVGGVTVPANDPHGLELFKAAIKQITELKSMRSVESLSDGIGNSVVTDYTFVAPNKMKYTTATGDESIAIGSTEWVRHAGSGWMQQPLDPPASFPAALPGYYSGAAAFEVGRVQVVDGEPCQIITFAVPGISGERDPAWYAWWVGVNTHFVRREAMVAQHHYVVTHYFDQNTPLQILPPTTASR
ncbi:MAG TPA: copper resistance protein CopC [Thermomicrobiaceae bacterium]|nr:copper resistance protein CopC [Thermomicrobiaceae bacterium]